MLTDGAFTPDVELIEAIAGVIHEATKATSNERLIAFSVLRRLHDLGIELPLEGTAQIDGREGSHYYGDACLGGHGELADIEAREAEQSDGDA